MGDASKIGQFNTAFVFPIGNTLGGANIWSARMCGHLERAGRSTQAIMHANTGWHPDEQLPIPPVTRKLDVGSPPVTEARLRHIRQFAAIYEQALPAVIVPNWNSVTYAVCAELSKTRSRDLRVVGVAHGNNESYYGPLTKYESIIHGFIAVSDEIAVELRNRLPRRANDIHTRACPVDVPPVLQRAPRDVSRPLVITYAGRITNHEKRVSDLVPLIRELDRQGVDFRFRIIGEGGYLPTLKWEIRQLPEALQARISVEGIYPPDAMTGVWNGSDISVLVSDSEGTSISMLEAMAAGCVPVVTRVSGTAAVIRDQVNGFTVPVGDLAAMASHIRRLSLNVKEWEAVSRQAHATVSERYSYPRYVPWFVQQLDVWQAANPRVWAAGRKVIDIPWKWPPWMKKMFRR